MKKLNNNIRLSGVLVSTTDEAMALKLGKKVNLKRRCKKYSSRYTYDDNHLVVVTNGELFELAQ